MGGGGSLAHVVAPALLLGKVLALERRNFLVGGVARRDGSQFSRFELRATLPGLLHQKHAVCRRWRGWLHSHKHASNNSHKHASATHTSMPVLCCVNHHPWGAALPAPYPCQGPTAAMLCVAGMAPQECLEAAFRCAVLLQVLQLRQSAHNWQRSNQL